MTFFLMFRYSENYIDHVCIKKVLVWFDYRNQSTKCTHWASNRWLKLILTWATYGAIMTTIWLHIELILFNQPMRLRTSRSLIKIRSLRQKTWPVINQMRLYRWVSTMMCRGELPISLVVSVLCPAKHIQDDVCYLETHHQCETLNLEKHNAMFLRARFI